MRFFAKGDAKIFIAKIINLYGNLTEKVSMKLPAEIKLKSSSFASFLEDERSARSVMGLYVLQLVLSACFIIFAS